MESVVKDLIKDQSEIHVVSETEDINAVLKTLYKHHIHSVPVVKNDSSCVAWIDTLDILNFLIKVATEGKESTTTPISNSLKDDDLSMLLERSKEWKLSTAAKVLEGKSLSDSVATSFVFLPVTSGAPVTAVFQAFAKGVSRIPVVDPDNQKLVVGVLTQSDIIKFLDANNKVLDDLADKKLKDLNILQGEDKIVSSKNDTITIDAFIKIHQNELNNVAIVNERGAIEECLSATDLKLISDFNFNVLLLPVKDFIKKVREGQSKPKKYLVYVNEDATVSEVIKKLKEERVHRVFVVGEGMKPKGVVSLTDISKLLEKKYKW